MGYLRIFSGDASPEQLELSCESTSIGRGDENGIVLKSKGVSKNHAIIEKKGHAFILIDKDSANGVYVNGQRVHRHTLRHWDEIQIFRHVLMFVDFAEEPSVEAVESLQTLAMPSQDETMQVDISSLGDLVKLKNRANDPSLMQMRESIGSAPTSSSFHFVKSQVTRYSTLGIAISACAVFIATLITSYIQTGSMSIANLLSAQRTNPALWILDTIPFALIFMGKYVNALMACSVNSLFHKHSADMQRKTEAIESQAMHDATHDSLTGLPNRLLFRDRLEQALLGTRRKQHLLALLVLDLDRFKEINDTLGHRSGDRLLKQIAVRLKEVVLPTDTLARLGGDEFAILLPSLDSEDDIQDAVKKIQRSFSTPFVINRMSLDVQASIGISLSPKHGLDVDTLLQRADVAMYVAKDNKRHFYIYDPRVDKHSNWRLSLLGQLRQAIANEDLQLHYQPKVAADTGQVQGVEALVRWNHHQFGLVSPDEFVHLAEQSGLIIEMTRWVMRTAVDQIMSWQAQGRNLGIAVNLSPSALLDPEFPDFMAGQLASWKLPPGTLTLEITESTLVKDPERALEVLDQLANQGIAISIDDFGTGYSSLAYLKKMSASELKIDKAFVSEMLTSESDAAIVQATIDLAHNLDLKVVAEGVENAETARALAQLKCDSLQGYHFCPPLPSDQVNEWLVSRNIHSIQGHRRLKSVR